MGQTGEIHLKEEGPIAWIIIDNPEKRNAISRTMWRQLDTLLQQVKDETRCIVVRGAGEQAFAAGADISEFEDLQRSPEDIAANEEAVDSAMARLNSMPQPTVAMISGYCIGGGMALALCCDIRLAADTSQFAVPAARIGIGYSAPMLKNLLETVSVPVAMDILASARRYSAAEALAVGLVNRVYPAGGLAGETEAYAAAIAGNAPLPVRAAKRTIRELTKVGPQVDLALCRRLVAECFASDDFVEGARAFMEKRAPQFSGH